MISDSSLSMIYKASGGSSAENENLSFIYWDGLSKGALLGCEERFLRRGKPVFVHFGFCRTL